MELGAHGEYVEKPHDIRPALERAFASGKPAVVNVITDHKARAHDRALLGVYDVVRWGPRYGPQAPHTLVTPRLSRGAPRSCAR